MPAEVTWKLIVHSPFNNNMILYEGPIEPTVVDYPEQHDPYFMITVEESTYYVNGTQNTAIMIVRSDNDVSV